MLVIFWTTTKCTAFEGLRGHTATVSWTKHKNHTKKLVLLLRSFGRGMYRASESCVSRTQRFIACLPQTLTQTFDSANGKLPWLYCTAFDHAIGLPTFGRFPFCCCLSCRCVETCSWALFHYFRFWLIEYFTFTRFQSTFGSKCNQSKCTVELVHECWWMVIMKDTNDL